MVVQLLKKQLLNVQIPQGVEHGSAPLPLQGSSDSGLPLSFEVVDGPGKVEGGKLITTGAGLLKLRAKQVGNDEYSAVEKEFLVAVAKGSQAITWTAIESKSFGITPFEVSASVDSNLALKYEVVSGPATIEGTKVTLTGGGEVVLKASQAGNDDLHPAEAEKSFEVA